tara:strand:+ start:544 stop:1362 length:819 start_codon:yes stop_codon:yes gene_type:complete
MIIWLASYPKSGNTLIRSMLSAYLFSKSGIFDFELLPKIKQFPNDDIFKKLNIDPYDLNGFIKNSIRGQGLFDNKNSVGFVKTHNMLFNFKKEYPFTNLNHTLGVIYLVRDPRNVALSYARHLDISLEEMVKFVTMGKGNKSDIMGNWSENYQSWKAFKEYNKYLLIKYEELISDREKTFIKILNFIYRLRNLNLSIDQNKLNNVINSTTLENLKHLETLGNFEESVKDKKGKKINFFDQGGKRDWSKSLNHNLTNEIENSLKKEMVELNYL